MNVVNGGAHADNKLDIQEFMIVPHGASSFAEALRMGVGGLPRPEGPAQEEGSRNTAVGDEGGFAPNLRSNEEAPSRRILEAIAAAGYKPGSQVSIALDVAASEFHEDERSTVFKNRAAGSRRAEQMVAVYEKWVKAYPLISIEDGLAEDDWEGWAR